MRTQTPTNPKDLADVLAFARPNRWRRRVHSADEIMARFAAKRLVGHLERAGFVVMKRSPPGGHSGSVFDA